MGKRIPEPDLKLSLPPFEISDHTASIKARRVMTELKEYASVEYWARTCSAIGLKEGASNTRRWQALLNMPLRRDDLHGIWLDRKGHPMLRPDSRKTDQVTLIMLATTSKSLEGDNTPNKELYLASMTFMRREIRHPERVLGDKVGSGYTLLRVTLHSLQRLIQRGYGLSDSGEISYTQLLDCLIFVWGAANQLFQRETSFPAEYRVEHDGAVFIVKIDDQDADLTLVTMLPPKK